MKDNRPNTNIQDKTSRPLHHSELALMFQRFKWKLEENSNIDIIGEKRELEVKLIEEFIIQENFRRDIFEKDKD